MQRIVVAWSGFQFELLIAIMCMLTGLPLGFGVAPSPSSIAAVLPTFGQIAWGISLSLGGASVVYGIVWRYFKPTQFIAGLYIERGGLYMLASSVSCFVIAAVVFAGAPSAFVAAFVGAFVAACISRTRSIKREIAIIRQHGGD